MIEQFGTLSTGSQSKWSYALSDRMRQILRVMGSVFFFIIVWTIVVIIVEPKEYLLPSPAAVLSSFVESRWRLFEQAPPTLAVILTGYLTSVLVAIPLAIAIVASSWLERLTYPLIVGFNAIPKVALAPLFVVWFGYGSMPRIMVTFSIVFFPILVSAISGLRSVDPEMIRLVRSMGATPTRVFLGLRFPNALPSIFSGLKIATSMAVIGAIIGEFVASDQGWGYMLIRAQGQLDTPLIFVIVLLLAVVATAFYYALELIERLVMPWHTSQRDR